VSICRELASVSGEPDQRAATAFVSDGVSREALMAEDEATAE
jgi:hypothetical protein